jgi:hypothetical protein
MLHPAGGLRTLLRVLLSVSCARAAVRTTEEVVLSTTLILSTSNRPGSPSPTSVPSTVTQVVKQTTTATLTLTSGCLADLARQIRVGGVLPRDDEFLAGQQIASLATLAGSFGEIVDGEEDPAVITCTRTSTIIRDARITKTLWVSTTVTPQTALVVTRTSVTTLRRPVTITANDDTPNISDSTSATATQNSSFELVTVTSLSTGLSTQLSATDLPPADGGGGGGVLTITSHSIVHASE